MYPTLQHRIEESAKEDIALPLAMHVRCLSRASRGFGARAVLRSSMKKDCCPSLAKAELQGVAAWVVRRSHNLAIFSLKLSVEAWEVVVLHYVYR